ncbi:MAG: rRNA maturation RNase YbeY [Methylococcales bacterium]|nr:rRNA maturation RNase YbeY [Methylococcales bacterium]
MTLLEIQQISQHSNLPTEAQFQYWVDSVLSAHSEEFEIVIRIVNESESAALNQQYRHKKGATNILSFPFEVPDNISMNLLGDLVICAPVIEQEARAQHKELLNHWAHLVIHGVLHLLGYDHLETVEAEEMEAKEIAFLKTININNPYQEI